MRKVIGTWRGWVAAMAAGVAGLLGGNLSQGAVAGAWETFFDQQNTDAWLVYDHYGKGEFYYPEWSGLPVNDEYAYFTYAGDSALTFIADSGVGNGAFAGDYQAQRIKGVGTDVYIGNLAELEYLECVLFATGPYGQGDYHSPAFFASDFAGSGWTFVNFSFSRPWYYWTGSDWVQVDPKTLTDIVELWFSFFPKPGSTGNSEVGIDNVTLEPTVVAPPVATALVAGTPRQFRMAFTPGPGLECRVERMGVPPASGWTDVTGQTGVKGPGEHVFLTPATGTGIFRVAADPFYQMVFSP